MPWAVSRWLAISKAPLRFHKIPCGFGVEQSDNVTGFSPSNSVFSCTYNITDAPSACCSYQKYKWAKPADIPNSNALSEIAERWIENTPTFLSCTVIRTSGRTLGTCIQSNVVAVIGEHWRGHYFHVVF
jgi:hypothetical protein